MHILNNSAKFKIRLFSEFSGFSYFRKFIKISLLKKTFFVLILIINYYIMCYKIIKI